MSVPDEKMTASFQWGDRVDHRTFGLGTVSGQPFAVSGPTHDLRGSEPKGWSVPVKWDDPSRKDGTYGSAHLRLVDRPNAKGGAFWNHEFQKLKTRALAARQATDLAITNAFRPLEGTGSEKIQAALAHEKSTLADLAEFLAADERGEHA